MGTVHVAYCILCLRVARACICTPIQFVSSVLCSLQVLLEDFSNCRGYKFLHDYLLYLERKTSDEAREVLRNVVLLIQGLVMAGFLSLEPTITDGGPFQDPGFQIPAPLDPSNVALLSVDA